MEFSKNIIEIYNALPAVLLIFFRISSFLIAFPMFSMTTIPRRVLVLFSLFLTLLTWQIYPQPIPHDLFSFEGFQLSIIQIGLGLISGFVFTLLFNIFIYLGELLAMQTGLSFASLVDPKIKQMNILGQFYWLCTAALFLSFNGHLQAISMLINSFHSLPISTTAISLLKFKSLIDYGSIIFSGTILIALPVTISLLCVNIIFAVISRSFPQLNVLSIIFPLILLLGLIIIYLTLENIMGSAKDYFSEGFYILKKMYNISP